MTYESNLETLKTNILLVSKNNSFIIIEAKIDSESI